MASYNELSINQKINTKATLQAWVKYTIVDFQRSQDKRIYGLRTNKKGIQRSSLGKDYKFGRGRGRTNQLRRSWWQTISTSGAVDRIMIEFLLYGRFVDMGVGKGTSHTDRQVSRILKLGRVGRSRKAWYSKTKTHQIKRLREILAAQNIHLMFDAIETVMNFSVTVNL